MWSSCKYSPTVKLACSSTTGWQAVVLQTSTQLQMSSHEGVIQLQELQLGLYGECLGTCWHPLSVKSHPVFQEAAMSTCPFFRETDLPESPGWQYWTQTCFGVSWEIKVKLFVADLLAPKINEPVSKNSLNPYMLKSTEGLSCLPYLPCPLAKALSKVNWGSSLLCLRAVGWITAVHFWQKECLSASCGRIPSLKPLTGTCSPSMTWCSLANVPDRLL